nr:hypothetical protein [Tanacetum cinerariifolium]
MLEEVVIYHEQVVLRYPNRKRENIKWLNKAIDKGPYEFKEFTPSENEPPRMQKEEDLKGDDLKHYEAEIEATNLILISIPIDIYNSMDACTYAQAMWQRVECLMRGTVQNKVDRKHVSIVTLINLLLNKGKHLLNASRAKKLEKSHDPLALVAHTGSSSRTTSPYYVTHPSSVVDNDEDYQRDAVQNTSEDHTSVRILLARAITQLFSNLTNNRLRTSSNTRNQAIVQADKVQIQSRNSGNDGRNTRRSYVQEEVIEGTNVQNDVGNIQRTLRTTSSGTIANVQCYNCNDKGHYARNCPNLRVRDLKYFMEQMFLAKQDEAGVILTDEHNDFLFADASRMEEIKELSANICLMARIQPVNFDSNEGPSYDYAFQREMILKDIKEIKDVFDSTENDLSDTWKQNELLKDQLLKAKLKHEIEC